MNKQFKKWMEQSLEMCLKSREKWNHNNRPDSDMAMFHYFDGKVDVYRYILRHLDDDGNYIPLVNVINDTPEAMNAH